MKVEERNQAIVLRKAGISMGEIAKRLKVAKSTVSYWVRGIHLSKSELKKLAKNSHSKMAIELRRESRLRRHTYELDKITKQAIAEAGSLRSNQLWCVAVSLYWGEGGKTQRTVRIANSDPDVIRLMVLFFRKVCNVPISKMRGHVHTFSENDVVTAEKYWSKISGLPRDQFFKAYIKNSSATKNKRRTLPYGTFQLYVHDSVLFTKMMAWISYLKEIENYD